MVFESDRSSFGIRVMAFIIDGTLMTLPIALFIFLVNGRFSLDFTQGMIWNLLYVVYSTITPVYWDGYVIGKKIMNIKIVKANGSALTLSDMFLREVVGVFILGYLTAGMSTLISGLMVLFRKDRRAIHDMLAGTFVENTYD